MIAADGEEAKAEGEEKQAYEEDYDEEGPGRLGTSTDIETTFIFPDAADKSALFTACALS